MSKSIKLKNNVYLDAHSLKNLVIYKAGNITFSDYASIISNTTLGVDDCTNYVWYVNTRNWEYTYNVDGVSSSYITIRGKKISGVSSATVNLINSGTYVVDIIGILKV